MNIANQFDSKKIRRGGWQPDSPRKKPEDKMVAVPIMVKRKYMIQAIKHLKIEAEKFR